MKGWIALHRTIYNDPLWTAEKFTKGQAWVDLLLRANHADAEVVIGLKTILVKRGQILTSTVKLADRWGWNRKTVTRFITVLTKRQQVDSKTDRNMQHGNTVISIKNYEKYQDIGQQDGQEKGQQRDSKRDTNNNDNNVNNAAAAEKILSLKGEKASLVDGKLYVSGKLINSPIAYLSRIEASTPDTKTPPDTEAGLNREQFDLAMKEAEGNNV